MITNALNVETKPPPKALAQQEGEFAAEGAPPPAYAGTGVARASGGIGASPPPTASILNDEWDMLMISIQERLRLAAGAVPHQDRDGVSEPVRACVLECVQALQQLQALRLHAGPQPGGGERLAAAHGRFWLRAQER